MSKVCTEEEHEGGGGVHDHGWGGEGDPSAKPQSGLEKLIRVHVLYGYVVVAANMWRKKKGAGGAVISVVLRIKITDIRPWRGRGRGAELYLLEKAQHGLSVKGGWMLSSILLEEDVLGIMRGIVMRGSRERLLIPQE